MKSKLDPVLLSFQLNFSRRIYIDHIIDQCFVPKTRSNLFLQWTSNSLQMTKNNNKKMIKVTEIETIF